MAFYKEFNQKKMTRSDHLRSDSHWEEEGTRYRRSTAQSDAQRKDQKNGAGEHNRPYGEHKPYGKPGSFHDDHHGFKKNDRSAFQPRDHKPAPHQDRPASAPKPAPAVKPAPMFEDAYLPPENLLSGRNPIREAIKTGRDIEKLLVAKGVKHAYNLDGGNSATLMLGDQRINDPDHKFRRVGDMIYFATLVSGE